MKTKTIIVIALMTAIAEILTFWEFNVSFFPSFLKFDFALLPAILSSLLFSPISGVLVTLITNLLHLLRTTTGGIGELANFLIALGMLLPAGLIYVQNKTKKSALMGLFCGILGMIIVGSFANYFILFPFYARIMPISAIIKMVPNAHSLFDIIFLVIVPFNAIKGLALSLITWVLYKRLSKIAK